MVIIMIMIIINIIIISTVMVIIKIIIINIISICLLNTVLYLSVKLSVLYVFLQLWKCYQCYDDLTGEIRIDLAEEGEIRRCDDHRQPQAVPGGQRQLERHPVQPQTEGKHQGQPEPDQVW